MLPGRLGKIRVQQNIIAVFPKDSVLFKLSNVDMFCYMEEITETQPYQVQNTLETDCELYSMV